MMEKGLHGDDEKRGEMRDGGRRHEGWREKTRGMEGEDTRDGGRRHEG